MYPKSVAIFSSLFEGLKGDSFFRTDPVAIDSD